MTCVSASNRLSSVSLTLFTLQGSRPDDPDSGRTLPCLLPASQVKFSWEEKVQVVNTIADNALAAFVMIQAGGAVLLLLLLEPSLPGHQSPLAASPPLTLAEWCHNTMSPQPLTGSACPHQA